jgi:hypothetical protein
MESPVTSKVLVTVTKTLEVTGDSMMCVINVKGVTKTLEVTGPTLN